MRQLSVFVARNSRCNSSSRRCLSSSKKNTSDTSSHAKTTSSYLEQMFSLEGRSAIVTGGGTGIGAALATGLARAGAKVVLVGRRRSVLEETVRDIHSVLGVHVPDDDDDEEEGPASSSRRRAFCCPCDITRVSEIEDLVREAHRVTGIPPTILINNAGLNVRQNERDLTPAHFNESMELMLQAPFFLTRALAPHMRREQYGRVLTIASLQSFRAFPDSIPYAAAKAGVLGLTRALAEAYGNSSSSSSGSGSSGSRAEPGAPTHANITCNAIAPGYVETQLTRSVFDDPVRAQRLADAALLGRTSVPGDLVGAALFLTSPAAAYITGVTLPVDGGFLALGMR